MVGGIRPGRETRGEKPQPLEHHAHQHQGELRRAHQCRFGFLYVERKGHRRDGGSCRGSTRHAHLTRQFTNDGHLAEYAARANGIDQLSLRRQRHFAFAEQIHSVPFDLDERQAHVAGVAFGKDFGSGGKFLEPATGFEKSPGHVRIVVATSRRIECAGTEAGLRVIHSRFPKVGDETCSA